ncbi:MAG: hypothetical protein H7Z74_17640 [Anaerolineae bacterium]|nr:hypothetical protein [Gemmatimonadaceae bacterium]
MNRTYSALLLFAISACATKPSSPESSMPGASRSVAGAASPRAAVEEFLAAIKAEDIQTLTLKWGYAKGPARDGDKREQLEKSALIMQCFLDHETYRVLNDMPGEPGKRVFRVELVNGTVTRQTNFTTVEGPSARWYVESADLEPVKDICRNPPTE